MPYEVVIQDKQVCVVPLGGGVPVRCYNNDENGAKRASALVQALYTNVEDAVIRTVKGVDEAFDWAETVATMRVMLETFSRSAAILGPGAEKGMSSTVRNILESKIHQSFTIAADQLFSRGYLDRETRIALSSIIGDVLSSFGKDAENLGVSSIEVDANDAVDIANKQAGFSVVTTKGKASRWILVSSSNRRDRDKHLVTEAALTRAVAIGDATGFRGPLRWWHTKEKGKVLDLGTCDFQLMRKGFLIESGTFVSEEVAAAVTKVAHQLRASLGFIHPKSEPDGAGYFSNIAIYERSLLPRGVESNPFTALLVA